MKKSMKFISIFLTSIMLIVSTIPSISTVYASEKVSQIETNMEVQPVTSLTEEQINTLSNEIQSLHPSVSQQWIKEVINRQLQGDYTIPPTYSPFRAAWQGITVDQMGALLDTTISILLGGGTAGLANLIKVKGKHAAKSAIRSAISRYLGSWFVKQNYGIKMMPFLTTEELTFNHEIYNKINWV